MTEKAKVSVDYVFSFGAIKPKRKHRIGKLSRKGQFKTKERVQSDFLCKEINYEVI